MRQDYMHPKSYTYQQVTRKIYINSSHLKLYLTQGIFQDNVHAIMKKKALLLKDNLRYSGQYKKATMKTIYMVFQGILPISEIIPTWIKCKRDAHRANISSIKVFQ